MIQVEEDSEVRPGVRGIQRATPGAGGGVVTEVHLQIEESGAEPESLEQLSLLLRQEIDQLEVESVQPASAGEAPPGTRGGPAMVLGGLVVTLQPTLQIVSAVVHAVRDWLGRGTAARRVRLEIGGDVLEITGTTSEVQRRLADEWIRLHTTE